MEYGLIGCEFVFLFNIFINFFLQENDDAKIPFRKSLPDVAYKYFTGRFLLDVIVLLPIGYVFAAYVDKKFLCLMVLKGLRVIDLNYYISDKFLGPYIRSTFTWIRKAYAKHGDQENHYEDSLFIEREIYILNIQRIWRMAM